MRTLHHRILDIADGIVENFELLFIGSLLVMGVGLILSSIITLSVITEIVFGLMILSPFILLFCGFSALLSSLHR